MQSIAVGGQVFNSDSLTQVIFPATGTLSGTVLTVEFLKGQDGDAGQDGQPGAEAAMQTAKVQGTRYTATDIAEVEFGDALGTLSGNNLTAIFNPTTFVAGNNIP